MDKFFATLSFPFPIKFPTNEHIAEANPIGIIKKQ